jgi:hypothetical protein
MRFSPSLEFVAYTADKRIVQPTVTLRARQNGEEFRAGSGGNARWLSPRSVVYNSQAGELRLASTVGQEIDILIGPGGNTVAAAAGLWAVGRSGAGEPRRVITSWGEVIAGAASPALSADGRWLAYVAVDAPAAPVNTLRVRLARAGAVARDVHFGPIANPRFSHIGATLVWEEEGRVCGIFDAANEHATVDGLTAPGWKCSQPIPIWTGREGYVGMVRDLGPEGEMVIAPWGQSEGYVLARSTGSGFEWDVAASTDRVLAYAYLSPDGLYREGALDLLEPRVSLVKSVDPEPADTPFVVDPNGVVEDIWPWLTRNYPTSPDGRVIFIPKSDESSADGRAIGEHWDTDGTLIGHVEDASAGYRIYQGKRYSAEEWVRLGEPVPWGSLRLDRNWFSAGARLWLPRRCVTGYRQRYVTDITWTSGRRQPNIPIEIRVDVGRGVINGREVRVRGVYDPGGNPEINFYGPSGWVSHKPAA